MNETCRRNIYVDAKIELYDDTFKLIKMYCNGKVKLLINMTENVIFPVGSLYDEDGLNISINLCTNKCIVDNLQRYLLESKAYSHIFEKYMTDDHTYYPYVFLAILLHEIGHLKHLESTEYNIHEIIKNEKLSKESEEFANDFMIKEFVNLYNSDIIHSLRKYINLSIIELNNKIF